MSIYLEVNLVILICNFISYVVEFKIVIIACAFFLRHAYLSCGMCSFMLALLQKLI